MRGSRLVLALGLLAAGGCSADDGAGDASAASPQPLRAAFLAEFDHRATGPTSCPVTGVRFEDRSRGESSSWAWTFGHGSTSRDRNPTWETELISAEVTLTVRRGEESDSSTQSISTAVC